MQICRKLFCSCKKHFCILVEKVLICPPDHEIKELQSILLVLHFSQAGGHDQIHALHVCQVFLIPQPLDQQFTDFVAASFCHRWRSRIPEQHGLVGSVHVHADLHPDFLRNFKGFPFFTGIPFAGDCKPLLRGLLHHKWSHALFACFQSETDNRWREPLSRVHKHQLYCWKHDQKNGSHGMTFLACLGQFRTCSDMHMIYTGLSKAPGLSSRILFSSGIMSWLNRSVLPDTLPFNQQPFLPQLFVHGAGCENGKHQPLSIAGVVPNYLYPTSKTKSHPQPPPTAPSTHQDIPRLFPRNWSGA